MRAKIAEIQTGVEAHAINPRVRVGRAVSGNRMALTHAHVLRVVPGRCAVKTMDAAPRVMDRVLHQVMFAIDRPEACTRVARRCVHPVQRAVHRMGAVELVLGIARVRKINACSEAIVISAFAFLIAPEKPAVLRMDVEGLAMWKRARPEIHASFQAAHINASANRAVTRSRM